MIVASPKSITELKNIIARAKGTLSTVEYRKEGTNHRIFVDGNPTKIVFNLESVTDQSLLKGFDQPQTNLAGGSIDVYGPARKVSVGLPAPSVSAGLRTFCISARET